jgi:hypothetical protein
MQRWIERPLRNLHDVLRHLFQALRDGIAMHRAERHNF